MRELYTRSMNNDSGIVQNEMSKVKANVRPGLPCLPRELTRCIRGACRGRLPRMTLLGDASVADLAVSGMSLLLLLLAPVIVPVLFILSMA